MKNCRLCGHDDLTLLIDFGEHPIAHRLPDRPDVPESRYGLSLAFCRRCGLIQIEHPIPPEELYANYHVLSGWKPTPHLPRVLDLVQGLAGVGPQSSILEVGCNDGVFLAALRDRGFERLVGIEPAADARDAARERGIDPVADYLSSTSARILLDEHGPFDLLIARHVLEHIEDLDGFARAMRMVLRPGGRVLIEVPDFSLGLKAPDYSAVWEEHVNYFTLETLNVFLQSAGIRLTHHETALFSGRALISTGRFLGGDVPSLSAPAADSPEVSDAAEQAALGFRDEWPAFRQRLHAFLREQKNAGRRIAVYGAGCRTTSLINFSGIAATIDCILDDQPQKIGKLLPGSKLPIRPGSALAAQPSEASIDLCLLSVNAENEDKVLAKHRDFLNRGGEFLSLSPPSPRLAPVWPDAVRSSPSATIAVRTG